MESEINRKIREILEKFGIETEYPKAKVIGDWNLIGHLKNLFDIELASRDKQLVKRKYAKK